jgi:hypothetical protein
MKMYGGVDVQINIFLTSALVGCEWPASRPGRLTPGEGNHGTHWIGGWVGPRTGLDDVRKRKLPGLNYAITWAQIKKRCPLFRSRNCLFYNRNIRNRVHKSRPTYPNLSQLSPVHISWYSGPSRPIWHRPSMSTTQSPPSSLAQISGTQFSLPL